MLIQDVLKTDFRALANEENFNSNSVTTTSINPHDESEERTH